MNNPPSPYPDSQPEQSGQEQESQMMYSYPDPSDQLWEPEMAYGYPHAAGFPQPGYPPTQPANAQTQAGYVDLQQPGYVGTQQSGYALFGKNLNSLWIAITALALLLLVASGSLYYYFLIRSTPEKTLQTYCNAIKSDDAQALYNTYSSEAQSQVDETHLQQSLKMIEFFSGGIEGCSVDAGSMREHDPRAVADVTFTLANGDINNVRLHLIDENGQWKIENNTIRP